MASGIGQGQWRHREGVLTGHPQQHPARHQDLEPRTERHQVADQRSGRQHVLEVIQHQQRLGPAQSRRQGILRRGIAGLHDTGGPRQGCRHQAQGP